VNQTRHQHRRVAPVITVFILTLACGTLPAAARQDPGPAQLGTDHPYFCAPQRVANQYVGCDNLTGNGVPAPAWVEER